LVNIKKDQEFLLNYGHSYFKKCDVCKCKSCLEPQLTEREVQQQLAIAEAKRIKKVKQLRQGKWNAMAKRAKTKSKRVANLVGKRQ